MQVFKVYFKIIKANMKQISIYLIVFLALSLIFSISSSPKEEGSFSKTKTNAAFINLDEDTALTKGFKNYLSNYVNFVDVENKQEKLQDALFFRDVDYIITIPKDFTKSFLQGKPVQIKKTIVPNSTTGMYVDMAVNKYFNTARIYVNNLPGITQENLVKEVSKDASSEVQIDLKTFGAKKQDNSFAVNYFNYLAYSLFAMLVLGVSSNLMVFNNKNLKRRNLCSPMKDRTFNLQLIAANLAFALISYGAMVILGLILNRQNIFSYNGLLLCINALIFTIAALSVSYLAGLLIKNRSAQSAIANVLSLGLCFLSGVFVPQQLLSKQTLTIASFNPTYWYVKANNAIGTLSNFSFDNLSPIFNCMFIELAFAIAIFSVSLVVSKQKRMTNS
ncbi:MAG: ABC transporter permease [Bacillota bacterium]|nr:ABC transporter permease [Bacillota bacterium]